MLSFTKKKKLSVADIEEFAKDKFAGHYDEWRQKRINVIKDHYGEAFFKGVKLLEVGCGFGAIGAQFHELGAVVTCSDAREEYMEFIKMKYNGAIKTKLADLDNEWPFVSFWSKSASYDMVIDMGVLYHLKNYEYHLDKVCKTCTHLVLETEVSDSDDENYVLFTDEKGYDQAFNLVGCRPSANKIEKILERNGMSFVRMDDARLNHDFHRYDWKVQNTGKWEHGLRRFWVAKKS